MPEAATQSDAINTIFGPADRSKDGSKILSTYPAFYHRQQLEDLRDSVKQKEFAVEMGYVPEDNRAQHNDLLRKEKEKLQAIESSTPILSGADEERLAKFRKGMGKKIADLLFSRSDMMKGLADAYEEARRMTEPCLKVDGDEEAGILKACGVDNFSGKGMVTREDASKAWKIVSRLLGEPSNVEALRKA